MQCFSTCVMLNEFGICESAMRRPERIDKCPHKKMGNANIMSECKQNILIDFASHAIGLDYKRPYTRHGKKFYKPYRNYYDTFTDNRAWLKLESLGYARSYGLKVIDGCEHISFKLTRKGLDWLGNVLDIKIYDESR